MIQESAFNAPLALGLPSNDDDILNAKRLFNGIGRIAEPPGGFSPLFDRPLDETVRAFQRDRGLKEDGLITPAGPTERNIRRDRGELPAEPAFAIAELDITAPIGNGLTNEPEDIVGISKALGRLGLFNFDKTREPSPIISRRLVASIEKFQQDNGLPVTGELKQGDKAHEALKASMAMEKEQRSSVAQQKPQSVVDSAKVTRNHTRLAQNFAPSFGTADADKLSDSGAPGVVRGMKPIKKTVQPDSMYKKFKFDPKGPGEIDEALKAPFTAFSVDNLNEEARLRARKLLDSKKFTKKEVNAYLHALWSLEVTRKHGAEIAKRFGDAHEITKVNPDDERLKDLFNNNAGRRLALDPKNRNRPAEEIVLEALRVGELQVAPVPVPAPPGGVLRRRSGQGSPM